MIDINDFVDVLNQRNFMQNILVPILDGFEIVDNDESVLFSAINNDKYMEQYAFDGILSEGEDFNSHIERVISKTKNSMKSAGFENVDNSFKYYKDYKNKSFDFKIYLQDLIKDGKILRQYNIYFLDSKSQGFFQVSLTTCPYNIDDIEIIESDITTNMDNTMTLLMNEIKYR